MNMEISELAFEQLKQDLFLEKGDSLRFFPRYGGFGEKCKGFSLGIAKTTPLRYGHAVNMGDILFFSEEEDQWFFNDIVVHVNYDASLKEIVFTYEEAEEAKV